MGEVPFEEMQTVIKFLAVVCLVGPPAWSLGVLDPLALEWRHHPEAWVEDDYETESYPGGSGPTAGIVQWSLKTTVPSTSRNYTIHVGSLSAGLPNTFSFQLPERGSFLIHTQRNFDL